jgi:hypothetical protein
LERGDPERRADSSHRRAHSPRPGRSYWRRSGRGRQRSGEPEQQGIHKRPRPACAGRGTCRDPHSPPDPRCTAAQSVIIGFTQSPQVGFPVAIGIVLAITDSDTGALIDSATEAFAPAFALAPAVAVAVALTVSAALVLVPAVSAVLAPATVAQAQAQAQAPAFAFILDSDTESFQGGN